jgi:hypothetical protein
VSPHGIFSGEIIVLAKLKLNLMGMITTGTFVVPAPAFIGSVPTIVNGTPAKLLVHTGRAFAEDVGWLPASVVVPVPHATTRKTQHAASIA